MFLQELRGKQQYVGAEWLLGGLFVMIKAISEMSEHWWSHVKVFYRGTERGRKQMDRTRTKETRGNITTEWISINGGIRRRTERHFSWIKWFIAGQLHCCGVLCWRHVWEGDVHAKHVCDADGDIHRRAGEYLVLRGVCRDASLKTKFLNLSRGFSSCG